MVDPIPLRRPINWNRLRTDEAERLVRERAADTKNVVFSAHAFERIKDRSITRKDAQRILLSGYVDGDPDRTENDEWKVVVVKRMAGTREAGVVTIILNDDQRLFVKTVEWMD